MNFISASYNMYHNSTDITTFDGYILRIDCNNTKAIARNLKDNGKFRQSKRFESSNVNHRMT